MVIALLRLRPSVQHSTFVDALALDSPDHPDRLKKMSSIANASEEVIDGLGSRRIRYEQMIKERHSFVVADVEVIRRDGNGGLVVW
jgi:hypothetical protein